MKKINFLLLIITVALISCERDDICAEGTSTTPRLKIEFYDATSQDDLLSVPRLTAYGEGLIVDESGMEIEPLTSSDKTIEFNTNSNALDLPLRIGDEGTLTTTRFIIERDTNLRLDTDDTTQSNSDILVVSYIPQFQYVSRACGYKSVFTELQVNVEGDSDNWIQGIEIIEPNLENENTVHVRIFH